MHDKDESWKTLKKRLMGRKSNFFPQPFSVFSKFISTKIMNKYTFYLKSFLALFFMSHRVQCLCIPRVLFVGTMGVCICPQFVS